MKTLPQYLSKYIVEQNYEKYSALDHAVWRYVLRQLKNFLSKTAHESYLEGLAKTGIEIERIPRIENISKCLEKFGWIAKPVSGFIPPAAFMELQSLNILPIASDMRSINHLLYTPAPDIVHEAAGHAPIIVNAEYAEYLRQYAQVAKKAIISKEDLELYKAIRELSDIKENPDSTGREVKAAEDNLIKISKSISFVSEASELSRMNWWTAEYGLVGDLNSPKIFGAGLLSSVSESRWCLSDKVKRIPLSIDCIKQSYDITEPQPQLYVAKDFHHLSQVLEELSETMSYRIGGVNALERALKAASINTVELENKLQISGILKKYFVDKNSSPVYLQFEGPTQLAYENQEIPGHGTQYHVHGYGSPIGEIVDFDITKIQVGTPTVLIYESGVRVSGKLSKILGLPGEASGTACILSFENATCEYKEEKLFLPEWGTYDIVIGQSVKSVFGGPADRFAFGEMDDFVAAKVAIKNHTPEQKKLFSYYQEVRDLREGNNASLNDIHGLFNKLTDNVPNEWLLFVELVELSAKLNLDYQLIEKHLLTLEQKSLITDGLKLAYAEF